MSRRDSEQEHSYDSFLDSEDEFVSQWTRDKEQAKKIIMAARTKPKKMRQKWVPIGDKCGVSVSSFKGESHVSIRQCFIGPDGNYLPTKKGISLTAPQWKKLLRAVPEIRKMLKEEL